MNYFDNKSEIVIGFVSAVGTKLDEVKKIIKNRLTKFNYNVHDIRVSSDIIERNFAVSYKKGNEYDRINNFMNAGNELRKLSNKREIISLGIADFISKLIPDEKNRKNNAFLIHSLKTPEEVEFLRYIYKQNFFSISAYSSKSRRKNNLIHLCMKENEADHLIKRDENEDDYFGQKTRDTFHLSDLFIYVGNKESEYETSLERFINLIFGLPNINPTFDEFAMFMAFSSSIRSGDLSRQVGAVISKDNELLATGANDTPRFGGGLYWTERNADGVYLDEEEGKDYKKGVDSNQIQKNEIVNIINEDIKNELNLNEDNSIVVRDILLKSEISNITEYGRAVHAEMEAILSCSRTNRSAKGANLYCTTYPCHNCAKHIVAAGIRRVIYIEPYPKSKAIDLHHDSIEESFSQEKDIIDKVKFEPFVGVGPRRFFDLFSICMGTGLKINRKDENGKIKEVAPSEACLRFILQPRSYLEDEQLASKNFYEAITQKNEEETGVNKEEDSKS